MDLNRLILLYLDKLRKEAEYSRKQIADKLNIPILRVCLKNPDQWTMKFDIDQLGRMAALFNMTPQQFIAHAFYGRDKSGSGDFHVILDIKATVSPFNGPGGVDLVKAAIHKLREFNGSGPLELLDMSIERFE